MIPRTGWLRKVVFAVCPAGRHEAHARRGKPVRARGLRGPAGLDTEQHARGQYHLWQEIQRRALPQGEKRYIKKECNIKKLRKLVPNDINQMFCYTYVHTYNQR